MRYDELKVLSYIVNELAPPFSLTRVSRSLDIPKIKVSRILKKIQQKWRITITLNIDRICLRKIMVLSKMPPGISVTQKAAFTGRTIENKYVFVFFTPGIEDPYELIDRIDGVVSYYVFDKIFYNKPVFERYFENGYLMVDLKSILLDIIDGISLGEPEYAGFNELYPVVDCVSLSVLDKRIIEELLHNGLLSIRTLTRKLNAAQNKVVRRIQFLVRKGIIPGFAVEHSSITDIGKQLFWIVFIIKFNDSREAVYFVKKLMYVPFIGHIDYNSKDHMVKLVLGVYRGNIGYVYDIARIIGGNLNIIDTMIIDTRTMAYHPDNIFSNNASYVEA